MCFLCFTRLGWDGGDGEFLTLELLDKRKFPSFSSFKLLS